MLLRQLHRSFGLDLRRDGNFALLVANPLRRVEVHAHDRSACSADDAQPLRINPTPCFSHFAYRDALVNRCGDIVEPSRHAAEDRQRKHRTVLARIEFRHELRHWRNGAALDLSRAVFREGQQLTHGEHIAGASFSAELLAAARRSVLVQDQASSRESSLVLRIASKKQRLIPSCVHAFVARHQILATHDLEFIR